MSNGMWLRSLAVGAVSMAVLLSGCSGDSEKPGTLPSESPTPTKATPSPTPTPVAQQVEDAVRAYYAELTRAAQTNDTSRLKLMVDKNCPCFRAVRVIDGIARRGERTPDARFQLTALKIHDVRELSAAAETRSRDGAYDVVSKSGKVIDHVAAARTHLDLSMIRLPSGRWVVANFFDMGSGR